MKRTIVTGAVIAFALLAAGCNTVRGFGQDMQKAGEKIEEKANHK